MKYSCISCDRPVCVRFKCSVAERDEEVEGWEPGKATRWMARTWEEVKPEVITRCLKHVGMYPDEVEAIEIDDPFAGEEERRPLRYLGGATFPSTYGNTRAVLAWHILTAILARQS